MLLKMGDTIVTCFERLCCTYALGPENDLITKLRMTLQEKDITN